MVGKVTMALEEAANPVPMAAPSLAHVVPPPVDILCRMQEKVTAACGLLIRWIYI